MRVGNSVGCTIKIYLELTRTKNEMIYITKFQFSVVCSKVKRDSKYVETIRKILSGLFKYTKGTVDEKFAVEQSK